MEILRKIVSLFALLAFSLAILGVMGGNGIIAVAQGAILVSLLGYLVLQIFGIERDGGGLRLNIEGYLPFRPSMIGLVCLVVFYFLSVVLNWESYERPFRDIKKLRYELIVVLVLLVPCFRKFLFSNHKWQRFGFWLAWGSAVVVAVTGFIAMKTDFHPLLMKAPTHPGLLDGISGSLMSFAYTLQYFVLLAAALVGDAIFGPGWSKRIIGHRRGRLIFLFATLVFFTIALYLTYRRGPAIGIIVGGICLLIMFRNVKLLVCSGVSVVLVLFVAFHVGARQLDNVLDGDGIKTLGSDNIRLSQWRTASLAFCDHPLFGLGHRQFEKQCAELKKKYRVKPDYNGSYFDSHAHSNYFEAFASNGVFGGVAFIAFSLFWIYELVRSSHAKLYFLPIALAFAVSGFFENTFTDSEVLHSVLLLYFLSQITLDAEEVSERNFEQTA